MSHSDHRDRLDRRQFLRLSAAGFTAGALPWSARATADPPSLAPEVKRYVPLGRTGLEISDISFGSSSLHLGEEAIVRHALERGVNYFDSAETYAGGEAERALGRALGSDRERVYVTSKTKCEADTTAAELMRTLEQSLRRLETDRIDVYFNHAVNDVDRLKNDAWYAFTERAKRQGKIRFTGMSGHAGHLIECLDYALDNALIDVMLVAYNFGQDPAFYERFTRSFDFVAKQPGLPRVLAKAHAQGVGVATMKTLMGAKLNNMRPYEDGGATFAQAALRWVLSNDNVDAAVISMKDQALVNEYLGASGWQSIAARDGELLERYAQMHGTSYCKHACNACEGACPFGVAISDVLRTRMYAVDYGDVELARRDYGVLAGQASPCLTCTATPCRGACPHGLEIEHLTAPTHRLLA